MKPVCKTSIIIAGIVFFLLQSFFVLIASEFHVSTKGSDKSSGSEKHPFRSIQHAADIMQAGDVCIIHGGTYREWIKPPRGGISDSLRIQYIAAKGEKVIVKGSERITAWEKSGKLWKVEIDDSFFAAKNPFKRNISGDWLFYGFEYHLGDIYLNDVSLKEKFSLAGLEDPMTWLVEGIEGKTILYANFGDSDPNIELTEINVRESIFSPAIKGLGFITIDGLTFSQSAPQWAYWNAFEEASVSTYFGYRWIIQNCIFTDARCVALICGNDPCKEYEGQDISHTGKHIVRKNYFTRCGEAAIHGNWGWAGSLIEENLIEDINTKCEFSGMETGGMKIHYAVDVVVKGNIVRRVFAKEPPHENPEKYKGWGQQIVGIWIDWGAQGTRVTGNIVYDTESWAVFIQNSHGSPLLIDNNIFSGEVHVNTQGVIFAHNMFVNSKWNIRKGAFGPYWEPHSGTLKGLDTVPIANDKWWNNVFVGGGLASIKEAKGFVSDWNAFYGNAQKSKWGDIHSIADSFDTQVKFKTVKEGVEVLFFMNNQLRNLQNPIINRDFVKIFPLTGQGIEDENGNPLIIEKDILGQQRNKSKPQAGPLEMVIPGENLIKIKAGNN